MSANDNASSYVPPHMRGDGSKLPTAPTRPTPPPSSSTFKYGSAREGVSGDVRSQNKAPEENRTPRPQYSGGSGGGGGGGGYRNGPSLNRLGFHGNMTPDARLEDRLFSTEDSMQAGINFDKYDDIPVETSHNCPPGMLEFSAEFIGERLLANARLCGFSKPTPVQKFSIPIGIDGVDLMACAQTGSGKTAGFLFPVIVGMMKKGGLPDPRNTFSNNGDSGRYRKKPVYPMALVLAPVRELVCQIYDEACKFCYCTGIMPYVVYGGEPVNEQVRDLHRGCDLLVATPGRLNDLVHRGFIGLENVQFFILDEADRMLDMGFEPQIREICENLGMPTCADERQTFMFSATFPPEVQCLARDFMREYVFLTVGRIGSPSKDVVQNIEWIDDHDKTKAVCSYLERITDGLKLVFVETKRGADNLEWELNNMGIRAGSIHGDKSQPEREGALRAFRAGEFNVLVATDVAARGLDIPHVTHVVNYDMPNSIEDYIHRIGRTGRVGNVGTSMSYFNNRNSGLAKDLCQLLQSNDQECPEWLDRLGYSNNYSGSRGFGRGRGGSRGRGRGSGGRSNYSYGSRDVRKDLGHDNNSNNGSGGSRGGGGDDYPQLHSGGGQQHGKFGGGGGGGRQQGHQEAESDAAW